MKIAVSFLSSNDTLEHTLSKIDATSCDYIHVDMMDGKFVSAKTEEKRKILRCLSHVHKPLDVHVMVVNPEKYITDFAMLPTEFFTFHYEAVKNPKKVIDAIREVGFKVGMSIKPKTSVEEIKEYLPYLDQVLVMSVEPGAGGQAFLESSLDKIKALKEYQKDYHYIISVDGGINHETALLVKEAGADLIVSGSYICKSDNYEKSIEQLK